MMKNVGYVAYQLREWMKQDAIASVFTDPQNPDDFIAGYVRAVGAKTALIQSIGPYGRYDGWFALRLYCVIEVQMDAGYAERLERLLRIHGEDCPGIPDPRMDVDEGDHIALVLRHAQRFGRVVTAWTESEAYTGFVIALDDLHATLQLLDFMGDTEGEISLNLLDIELLSLGSEEEQMYEKLNAFGRVK